MGPKKLALGSLSQEQETTATLEWHESSRDSSSAPHVRLPAISTLHVFTIRTCTMPFTLPAPAIRIQVEPLTQESFAEFGTVISSSLPPLTHKPLPALPQNANAVYANQDTAIKHRDVTQMENLYGQSKSAAQARPIMSMFCCAPRTLRRALHGEQHDVSFPVCAQDVLYRKAAAVKGVESLTFPVSILERHPFTFQTFVPMGLDEHDATTSYLVIVAASLDERQSPEDWPFAGAQAGPRGSGAPDVARLRAFLAKGRQAVTYGPGTWHAPMVVLGLKGVDFVVSQFANGVAEDDCQEVVFTTEGDGQDLPAVVIEVPKDSLSSIGNASHPKSPKL